MAGIADYTVGRGKPPLHTRFQKGQSGNPSGKPGPAKLARQRFERALYAALEGDAADLARSGPCGSLDAIARRLTLDAAAGRTESVKLILSVLDKEIAFSCAGPQLRRKRRVNGDDLSDGGVDGLSR